MKDHFLVALDNRILAIDNRIAEIGKRLDALDALAEEVKAIRKAIQVDSGGNITMNGSSVTLKSLTSLDITAAAALRMESKGLTEIKGAMVKLNDGSQPIARVNDNVVVTGTTGKIVSGNIRIQG